MKNFHCLLPPNRPGPTETSLLRGALGARERPGSAAVLGATPEYRSVLHELGYQVTVFERNLPFLESTATLVWRPGPEAVVEGDWLQTLPDCREQFDVILSDFTLGNVSKSDHDALQSLTAGALRSGGLLFDRVLHYRAGLCTAEQIASFGRQPINLRVANDFSCIAVFRSPQVMEVEKVSVDAAYAYALGLTPDLSALVAFSEAFVSPRGAEWSYAGQFRDPLHVYAKTLSTVHEVPTAGARGFTGCMSVIIGRR